MKKILLVLLILILISNVNGQNYKNDITIELRYPVPIGDNFLNKGLGDGYSGIIDFGVGYHFIQFKNLGVGILFNSSSLKLSEYDLSLMILSPKIAIDYKIVLNKITVIPNIALGYSNYRFKTPLWTDEFGNAIEGTYKKNENGLTFKGSTKFLLTSNKRLDYYLQFAYEFTKLEKPSDGEDSKYNRNIKILYPGIGLIYKFNKS